MTYLVLFLVGHLATRTAERSSTGSTQCEIAGLPQRWTAARSLDGCELGHAFLSLLDLLRAVRVVGAVHGVSIGAAVALRVLAVVLRFVVVCRLDELSDLSLHGYQLLVGAALDDLTIAQEYNEVSFHENGD